MKRGLWHVLYFVIAEIKMLQIRQRLKRRSWKIRQRRRKTVRNL